MVMEKALKTFDELKRNINNMILHRCWEQLTQDLETKDALLIREFYANAIEQKDHKVKVKGGTVSFSSDAINHY